MEFTNAIKKRRRRRLGTGQIRGNLPPEGMELLMSALQGN